MKKYVKIIAAVLIYIICMAPQCFSLSKIGSRGEEVRQIQNALVKRGYYIGTVDGIFGTRTEHVLKHFQRRRTRNIKSTWNKKQFHHNYG